MWLNHFNVFIGWLILSAFQTVSATSIRLVGGKTPYSGRLEVEHDGQWGTVCDDEFTANSAKIVCKMLGFTDTGSAHVVPTSLYGPSGGTILLDSLACVGNETDIAGCSHQDWGVTDCTHNEDISIDCQTEVQIVHGSTEHDGQVQLNISGTMQPLCADNFTSQEAKVICRMLGFSESGAHIMPPNTAPSGVSMVSTVYSCNGNEIDISMCKKRQTMCSEKVAAIDCRTPIRLVNGTSEQSGRVEVLHRGEWGTICDYNFDDRDAKVICRMLGFVFSRAKSLSGAYYGEGQGRIAVDELYCQGEETDISECKSRPWGSNNICTHSEDAAVECSSELRLYDGPTEFSGRLELRRESTWKTVCADHFDNRTAQVVCNMLGFERGNISVYSDERFPAGSDAQMNGNGYVCMGNETDIANCKHYNVSLPCNAVAINCYSNTPVRLVDGTNMFNGRVEIYETFNSSNGDWKGLCYDNLTKEDAVVLCKMLGLSTPTPTIHDAYDQYNRGGLFSLLSGLGCNGSETDISGCAPQHKWNNDICLHSRHAAINCAPNSKLRLYNGSSIKSGRVEVLYNGSWLHVCRHSDMDRREFDLICQQLGFNQSGYQLVSMENIVTKGIRSLECRGAESDISDCRSGQWDVVGYCIPETIACNSTVRLINGSSERSGRVEVLNQGKWGTICADGFDITEANVVCRKAGIRLWNASVLPGSPFGKGSAESILGNVSCKGNESDLSECNSSPWKLTKCGKEDVATVDCRVQNTPLRLVGGKTKYSGRVELFYEGTWRSYCHEYNTQHQENLELLCQLLGYNYSSYARYLDYVYLNGMSLFHDLSCNGNESDISLCPSSDWGNYSCSYYTAIDCLSPIELIGGLTDYMGFVKINSNFLCADNLTGETQAVLCNMLGYSFTSDHALTDKEHFRPAFSHLNMVDDIICSGDEKDYQLCRPTDWNRGNCSSGRPAYVHCNTPVRLRDRANIYNGTVEIYQNATWSSVCFDNRYTNQNLFNARVSCLMMGFSNSLTSYGSIPSNSNSSVSMNCTGNEADVSQCRSVQNVSCSHIITVKCPTDISLANGKTKYMGALAVQTGSRTTRIRSFINDTLKTVCRLLGFNLTRSIELEPSNEFLRNKFETAGEVIRELYCQGNETDIAECTESTVDSYVGQWESGINCQTAIRLTDGEPYIHGVLQMKFQETWYNTCADGFTLNDGFVVCRMLGHRHVSNVVVTQVSGKKVAFNGNLRCTGNEVDISKCPGYNYFLDNCSSNQGLRIDCRTKVRLVDGLNTKGRVEVFYNGTWGHVCTDWGNQDSVLCRSAGFSYTYGSHLSQMTFSNKSIGNSTAVFLQCTGYEKSITECNWNPRNGINEPCNSMYPLEIECNTHVSLKPGISKYSGWIAVDFLDPDLYSTQYASVCGEQFDLEEADIFCKAIGSPTERNATIIKNNKYGSHYNFVIAHLDCVGNETDVRECRSDRWSENHNSCNASDTNVAINCQPKTLMRMQGKDRLNGLVEIFFDAQWYTMCGDGFGVREAAVVCHNLGYKVGIPQIVFNSNSSLIYKMDCAGNETDISQCEFRTRSWVYNEYPWTPGDCSSLSHDVRYGQRAGVICSIKDKAMYQRVRLVSDVNNYQGRVEFQYLGVWGTVCSENFTQNDARLVCKLGGYSGQSNITIHNSTKYGRGDGALVVDNLLCDGDESDLDQCDSYPWTKNTTNQFCLMHAQDAGVNCRPETPMRLAGGTVYSGRVEIEYEGTWGTICDKEFDDVDAKVICRMKGFNTESLIVLRNGFYGHGNGNVIISNLACRGDESDISECDVGYRTSSEKARWGNPSELCSHANDVAIQCNTPVRLREGWTFYSGIAEVFLRGQWRRICRDNFTTHDAEALCKLSGKRENYSGNITIHTEQYLNADFKESQLGGFGCTGHENDLYECGSGRWVWNYQPCPSEQNVALNCRATTNVRLMNGLKEAANNTLPLKGRVEIKYTQYDDARHRDNHWGTICDDQFGDDDALVLCSMMGYSVGRVYRPDTEYESFGNETILLDDLQCLGNEADVSECKAREWGTHDCVHDEDVSISCNYQNNIDPCDKENYKRLPNLEMRLVNYITKSNPINDNKLSLDWYYVGNNTLPDKEPPFNRCSTVFPIYSKDLSAIPTMVDKIKSFKAEQSRDSSITYDLQVKNCGGYFVYRLGPTVTTNSGYCFAPPPSFVVNSVGVVYNETGTSIWFKCKFAPDIASNLYYQVEWHVMGNSEHITTKQYCSQSDMSPCFLSSKDLADMNVGMGTNISCGVRAFNEPVGQPGRLSVISDPFFLGIKLSTPRISLRRGEVKFVEMKLTVPIVCEDTWPTNNIKCIVNIDYFTPDYGSCPNAEGSFPGGCSTEITATTFGETIRVSVSAAETGQYGVAGKFNMFLQIPRTRGVAFLSVPYKLPAIEVEVLPESDRQWRGKLCTARNDPHMYTFDGRSYEHHAKEGDYILYRHSVYGNVEIQHRIANCTDGNNPAKCNCGVAVRAGRDVYVINVCNGYIDIGYRQCSDKALTVKKENDYTYTIYLPYGTAVRARIDNAPFMGRDGGRVLDISVNPSIKDSDGNSTGLCGSLNGNSSDDFDNCTKFIDDWKVPTNESLFDSDMFHKELEPWAFQTCTCKKTIGGRSAYTCDQGSAGCTQGTLAGYHSCGEILDSRTVRSVTRKPRRPVVKIPVSHQRPYVRHRRSVAEEDLSKLCEDHFRTIQNMCKKIPHTHTNVSVENCVLDIKLTNTTDWISMSKQSMLDTCQNEIRRNSTVIKDIITKAEANSTTASGNVNTTETAQANIAELTALREILSTSQTIKDSFCMNSCSGNGTCKQGTCECNIGFGATDCSIDLVTPPKIVGLLDHGLCDENKTDCSQIVVFGGEFASSNLTCRLRTFYFDIHRTVHNGITSTVPGHAETIVETLCPIRGLRLRRSAENMFVMGFHVSVSNDGQHFNDTNQGIAYIYNSECQTHTYTNHTEFMSSFSLKDDYCFIEGKCYFNGTFHASQIMICDPSVNASSWTTYQPLPKPILDCSNPEACKQKNHSVCEVKNGTPLCSCIRGFTQNQTDGLKCEQTSDIHVTDKVLDDDKGSLLIELKLDYNLPTTVTLNSSITYTKYENEVHDELMKFYRGQLGNRLAKVIIKDIRPGSLIVDHLVVYFQRAQILSDVTQVVDELSRHRLTISGTECPVIGVALGKEKVPVIEPKVDLCRLYKIIHPCNEDEVCETNNIGTSCVKKETHRDENGVSKLMVIVSSVIGGILFLVIVVLVFIVCKKRAKKPMALDRMEPKVHDNTYQDINLREMSVLSVGSTDVYRIPRAKLSGSQLAFQRGLGDARRDHLYERRRSETNEHPYG